MDWMIEMPNEVIPALRVVLGAITIDLFLGVLIALRNQKLDVRKLPQFLISGVIPYAGGLIVLAVAAEIIGNGYDVMFLGIAGMVLLKYIADVKDKIIKLFQI